LFDWLEADLPIFFAGRILAIDERAFEGFGLEVINPWSD
jgi:hypothetical protein